MRSRVPRNFSTGSSRTPQICYKPPLQCNGQKRDLQSAQAPGLFACERLCCVCVRNGEPVSALSCRIIFFSLERNAHVASRGGSRAKPTAREKSAEAHDTRPAADIEWRLKRVAFEHPTLTLTVTGFEQPTEKGGRHRRLRTSPVSLSALAPARVPPQQNVEGAPPPMGFGGGLFPRVPAAGVGNYDKAPSITTTGQTICSHWRA